jgi:hypothetical protein
MLTRSGSITPEWNDMDAYIANVSIGLMFPVFARLAFSLVTIDSFLNDPARIPTATTPFPAP